MLEMVRQPTRGCGTDGLIWTGFPAWHLAKQGSLLRATRARGNAEQGRSDQRRLIQREHRLIRSQGAVSGNFHQDALETNTQGKRIRNAVGAGDMAASVMVWSGVRIVVIGRTPLVSMIGFAMGRAPFVFAMQVAMRHSRAHPRENAENEIEAG